MADQEPAISVELLFRNMEPATKKSPPFDFFWPVSDQEGHPISKMLELVRQRLNAPAGVNLPLKLASASGLVLTQGPFVDPASEPDALEAWELFANQTRFLASNGRRQIVFVSLYTHAEVVAQQLMQCGNNKNCAEFLYRAQQWKEQQDDGVLKALVHVFQADALFIVNRNTTVTGRSVSESNGLMRRLLEVLHAFANARDDTKPHDAKAWSNAVTDLLFKKNLLEESSVVLLAIDLLDTTENDHQVKYFVKLLPPDMLHRNRYVVKRLVSKAHFSLFFQGLIPELWRRDELVMLAAVKNNALAFKDDAAPELQQDPGFVRSCIRATPSVMQLVPDEMMELVFAEYPGFDAEIMHLLYAKVHLSPRWTSENRDFIADAIECNPRRLEYAPVNLRNDLAIVYRAVELGASLEHAGPTCLAHAGLVHSAVQFSGLNIRFVPGTSLSLHLALIAVERLQNTADVLWDAVLASKSFASSCGAVNAFYDHVNIVCRDIDAVFDAMKHHFTDFKLAANAVVLCRGYMHNTFKLLQMMPTSMLDNVELAKFVAGLQVPGVFTNELQQFSARIRSDASCMRALVEAAADPFMQQNAEKVVRQYNTGFCRCMQVAKNAAPELWNNRDFVISVLSATTDRSAFERAGPELRADPEVVELACTKNSLSVQWASGGQQTQCRVLDAVRQDGLVLRSLDNKWQRDFETCLAAVTQNQSAFKYVHDSVRGQGKFVLKAMSVVKDFESVWHKRVSDKFKCDDGGFKAQCMNAWRAKTNVVPKLN